MRRLATITLTLSLVLGLTGTARMFADEEKKDAPKPEAPKVEAPKAETPKPEAPKVEAPKAEEAVKPIPKDVEAKLEAARHAVAEAIVAAQDAGLVDSSIEPPPILDILITGRATDTKTLKDRTGVSPEVFGAWFTGFGKTEGINAQKDVRIIQPSAGLKSWYDQRAEVLNKHIKMVRDDKAKAESADKAKAETVKAEAMKKEEEAKKKAADEVKKKEETAKAEAMKKEEEAKKKAADEAKKKEEAAKKDEDKKDDKKDDTKKEDAPK